MSYKNRSECKKESGREAGQFMKGKSMRNHRLRSFITNGKIVLDKLWI